MNNLLRWGKCVVAGAALLAGAAQAARAQDPAARYEEVYPLVTDYSGDARANEIATYAWGTSYAMMADVDMFRATGEVAHAQRALEKMSRVLAQRDDARGVVDYRGVSMAAWRNVHYQLPPGRPYQYDDPENDDYSYDYVAHSGMITYPMAALAEWIRDAGLEGEYLGRSYAQWADELVARVEETVAAHDDQWVDYGDDEGYYRFRNVPAHFRWYANRNRDIPFNQSHALGRTLLVLYRLTGNDTYYDKAFRLAQRFKRSLALRPNNSYVWMYWNRPGDYTVTGNGEDISHAAINASFAQLAYETGIVFDAADLQRFANTLTRNVFQSATRTLDDGCGTSLEVFNVADFVGGGARFNTYLAQTGRWLGLAATDPEVYARVANVFEYFYRYAVCQHPSVGSSQLLGHAKLVLYQ